MTHVGKLTQKRQAQLEAEYGGYKNVPVSLWNDVPNWISRNWHSEYVAASRLDEAEFRANLKAAAAGRA